MVPAQSSRVIAAENSSPNQPRLALAPSQLSEANRGFYEVWYLRINFSTSGILPWNHSLWLRMTTLSAADGSSDVAEVWAILTYEDGDRQFKRWVAKSTRPYSAFQFHSRDDGSPDIRIGNCEFLRNEARGEITGPDKKVLKWDLSFTPNNRPFFHMPRSLKRLGVTQSETCTPNPDLRFRGTITWGNQNFPLFSSPGNQGHVWGRRYAHRWAWAHANEFEDRQGRSVPAVFEVLTGQTLILGKIPSPALSAIFFCLDGDIMEWNTVRDQFQLVSSPSPYDWSFSAEKKSGAKLRGRIRATPADFSGVTYKGPLGRIMFCYNAGMASLELKGFLSNGRAFEIRSRDTAFETVSSDRLPNQEVVL